jgi:hypothetical protein
MGINLGKFVHTETGKILMSILLGFGLASLFRKVCKGKDCIIFHAPPLEQIQNKIYKNGNKCYKYTPAATKCNMSNKIINFE